MIEALAANPRALDKRIVQRLARLPAGPSRLTEAGLILGDPFTYGDAAALAGLDEAEARSALDTACRIGILQLLPDGGMSFVHESVREAYAMALPPPVAFRLRQRAAALRPSVAISGHVSHGVANAVASRENLARGWAELTSRERAVARLARTGASNRDLASQLFLSVNTIETHLKSVYAKLGIRSRRQLMTMSDG